MFFPWCWLLDPLGWVSAQRRWRCTKHQKKAHQSSTEAARRRWWSPAVLYWRLQEREDEQIQDNLTNYLQLSTSTQVILTLDIKVNSFLLPLSALLSLSAKHQNIIGQMEPPQHFCRRLNCLHINESWWPSDPVYRRVYCSSQMKPS